jgi:hypothetical protein
MRLVRTSILKLGRRPATGRIFFFLVGMLALIYVSLGLSARGASDASAQTGIGSMLVFPGAHGSLAGMLLIFCGTAAAAYAGVVAGSEWTWNTFRVAIARGESRPRYVLGLFLAVAVLAIAAWLALYVGGIGLIGAAGALSGTSAGDPFEPSRLPTVAVLVVSGAWAVLMEAAIGFTVAFVTRSAVAGIAAVVGLFFAERFGEMFMPADVLRFAPITAAEGLVKTAASTGLDAELVLPLIVTTVYLLAAIGVAAVAARRAEVA